MTFSKKYFDKQLSVVSAMKMFDVSRDDVLNLYPGGDFEASLTRNSLSQIMSLNVDDSLKEKLDKLCNISFTRDRRTPIEYAADLTFGWVIEDIILIYLNLNGFVADLVGADKDREFLSNSKISSDADMEINGRTADIYVDLDGYWTKNDSLDLRMSKYNKLVKEKSILIGVSPKNCQLLVLDFSKDIDIEIRQNPLWGGKEVATIKNIKNLFVGLDKFTSDLYNITHNK